MHKPNFFIVGGPKCGTTSLYEYLRQHPQVFMSEDKEPAYFGSDLQYNLAVCARTTIQNWDNYIAIFQNAGDATRIGEGSTSYLYSTNAAKEIHEFDPRAKIIIMLRNPVDVMYSQHGEYLFNCNENLTDFQEALEAQEDQRQGKRIPREAHFLQGLLYEDVVRYAEQVERYWNVFGREEVQVILFDDFVADTPAVFDRVLRYLEIDPDFRPEFIRHNASKPVGALGINRWFARRPGLRRLMNRVMGLDTNRRLRDRLASMLGSDVRTRRLDAELRNELQERLSGEVAKLGQLLGRDLSEWSRPRA